MAMIIATHVSPDWDAIASCWLLQRYGGMQDASIVFVNTGNPDQAVLESADAVVDTGKALDPATRRFDHHQLPEPQATDASAAMHVYGHLTGLDSGLWYLLPLIQLIHNGDIGGSGAAFSRELGIHALLSAMKARKSSDAELLSFGYGLLDLLDERLKIATTSSAGYTSNLAYISDD